MRIFILLNFKDTIFLDVNNLDSVINIKKLILLKTKNEFNIFEQDLLFDSFVLEDERALSDYNIRDGSVLFSYNKKK